MQIRRIEIENFRSIRQAAFDVPAYCVLIGENNAGKSNILRALNLILGESWPSERMFSDEDFHNQDTAAPIAIRVFFDNDLTDERNGYSVQIAGFELRCKAYKRRVGDKPAGSLKVEYECLARNGKTVVYPDSPLRSGVKHTGAWLPLRVSAEYKEQVPLIYVGVSREYQRENPGSRWSVLRRLFNEVNKEFANDKTLVALPGPGGKAEKVTRREAFERTVKQAYSFLRTPQFQDIERRLAANTLEQMGLDPVQSGVSLLFQNHDPTNAYKSLEMFVREMDIESPASEVGSGLQSAIVVGIFRTYQELKKEGAVFAIEEPEVFLHPQKARFFRDVLKVLADRGNQVLITTHSPVFVEVGLPESVALVRRTAADGTIVARPDQVDIAPTDRTELQLLTEFDAQRNELFFARRVLLVEGPTERIAFPLALRAIGIDPNREGVSVIDCGGKTKLPLFVRVVKAFGIPYVVIADHDIWEIAPEWTAERRAKAVERNADHKRWNDAIRSVADPDRLFFLDPDFEGVTGLPRSPDQKIERALEKFANIARVDIPGAVLAPLERLLQG